MEGSGRAGTLGESVEVEKDRLGVDISFHIRCHVSCSFFINSNTFRTFSPTPANSQLFKQRIMNVRAFPEDTTVYLPPEIVDRITSHLHTSMEALLACRLTCRILCMSATAVLIRANNTTSPSEFLTGVTLDTKRLEAIRKIANDCKYGCEPIMMPTVWTWLQIPEDLTIEDPYSKVGKRWAKLLGDFRVRSEQIVDLWGRVSERRGVVCLVHREWRLLPPNLH